MVKRIFWTSLLLALTAVCLPAESLRVMTFNVRYPATTDGPNRWEARRDLLIATIKESNPDVFGTQELFYEQGQYIVEKAPEYTWFGVSRRGNRTDEHMGVFYKPGVLRLVESGNFWLSENPETPGSMSWLVTLPRMVTWGLFEVKATRTKFYFYNTHFPHRAEDGEARIQCAQVIRRHASRLPKETPFILAGDFNADVGGEAYKAMVTGLTDAWSTAASKSGPNGTFHGFKGSGGASRIDWILFRGMSRAAQVDTVTKNENGRYPSDHFPVLAILEF